MLWRNALFVMPVNVPAACALMLNYPARVAANIFFFVFSQNFRQIINFVICEIFLKFCENVKLLFCIHPTASYGRPPAISLRANKSAL